MCREVSRIILENFIKTRLVFTYDFVRIGYIWMSIKHHKPLVNA